MAVRRMALRSSHERPMTKPKRKTPSKPCGTQRKPKYRKAISSPTRKAAPAGVMHSNAPGTSTTGNSTGGSSTKQARVIAMLRSPGGATVETMMRTTKWQPHSVRGFLARVVRKKLAVNLSSEDAKTGRVYRITEGGGSLRGKTKPAKAA